MAIRPVRGFHTVITTIPLADSPENLLVNEATNRLYVNVDGDATIAVIDGNTNTIEAVIPVQSNEEFEFALDEGFNYIYVTSQAANVVYGIDGDPGHATTFNAIVETIVVGNGQKSLVVDQLDHHVYVSNELDNTVSIINSDDDGDGISNSLDNCADVANAEQTDSDGDGVGDACDTDTDGDGVPDVNDAFPLDPAEWLDTDGDGTGNNADQDDDGDGFADTGDAFPLDPAEWLDTDGDGVGNNADTDDDADGILDGADNCPLVVNQEQLDTDNDGSGDTCDPDDDGDGIPDAIDTYPLDTDNDGLGNSVDPDDDNDGMPDVYEEANSLDPLDAADATADNDGDGASNLVEFQEGTDPNDPVSGRRVKHMNLSACGPLCRSPGTSSSPGRLPSTEMVLYLLLIPTITVWSR